MIGERLRKDLGDLQAHADSIAAIGLLRPIGVKLIDPDGPTYELVYGERTLVACRDNLKWETISACVVDVNSIMLAQIAENTSKGYTTSEKVAIAKFLRGYKHGGDRNGKQNRLTTEDAAQKLGMTKDDFYRANKVMEKGTPELIAAMDAGKISVSAAAALAEASPEEQQAILNRPFNEAHFLARAARKVLNKSRQRKEREALAAPLTKTPLPETIRLFHCPFQQLEEVAGLQPGSAKLILTDIPYEADFLPQIEQLGQFAQRMLQEGGVLAVVVGKGYLNQIMPTLDKYLTYRWTLAEAWYGEGSFVNHLNMVGLWYPILLYSKGQFTPPLAEWYDLIFTTSKEKTWHDWQKPLDEMIRLIDPLTQPGDLVVDTCAGSFTTGVACLLTGRHFVGCDIEEEYVQRGQRRLMETYQNLIQPPRAEVQLHHSQFQDLEHVAGLTPGSARLIFTDPPWNEAWLDQWADLGAFAERFLQPGGLLFAYAPNPYLDKVIAAVSQHLSLRYTFTVMQHPRPRIHPLKIRAGCKPILMFSKGDPDRRGELIDPIVVGRREKYVHLWQQSAAEAAYVIEQEANPGELVIDPCGGGFTTAAVCAHLGRAFVGCDMVEQCVIDGRKRIGLDVHTEQLTPYIEGFQ